ncbi:DUF7210 family protein [Pseudomonas panipatensis]|uniref:DUF7210 family protein n=1 Tax=Pseudomonas panipatensis TaxID=428992 RepID=UPI0035B42EC3
MTTPAKKSQAAAATDEQQLEKVTLIAPHKHAGVKLQAGDEIEVNAIEKAFLVKHVKIAGDQEAASAAKE